MKHQTDLSTRALRQTFGSFATGVTVVTSAGDHPHGMTANSFSSVSLEPPIISIAVKRSAVMCERLLEEEYFAVSVLGSDQQDIAAYFADSRRPIGPAEFDDIDTRRGEYDTLLIDGAVATFECTRRVFYNGGDHLVILGDVLHAELWRTGDALLFANGNFHHLAHDTAGNQAITGQPLIDWYPQPLWVSESEQIPA